MTGLDMVVPHFEATSLVAANLGRLALAAFLGGCIGMEREMKHKPAGLRTNMFICVGSALFTVLSAQIAAMFPGDHTRIAAQIIPGIGFIGAGSILHSRGSVQGLTTAATIFVVAAIGMATGGGLYLTATLTTLVVLLLLLILGSLEERFKTKPSSMTYEVLGRDPCLLISEINDLLESLHHRMESIRLTQDDGHCRLQFNLSTTHGDRSDLLSRLRSLTDVTSVGCFTSPERE